MSWQDLVISAGSAIITIGLIPTVLAQEKPALSTSLITGFLLAVFAITFFTLELWFTAFVNVFTSALWFTLAVQKYRRRPA